LILPSGNEIQFSKSSMILLHLGNICHCCGNYEGAKDYYREGRDLSEKLGDERKLGEIYKDLGVVAFRREIYQQTEEWFRQGLDLVGKIRDTALEDALLTNLAILLKD
jgi:tetratricopeptide (TPR) repeat protein